MYFTLDLLIRAFLGRGDWEVCHSDLCLLVVGSYSKTQVSSPVITRCRKSGSLVTRSKSSQETNTQLSFCSSDKFFGTSFAQIFLTCRSSVMIGGRLFSVVLPPLRLTAHSNVGHYPEQPSHEPHCSQFLKLKDALHAVRPQRSPFRP